MSRSLTAVAERRRKGRTPFRQRRRSAERIAALGVEMDLVRPEEVMHHVTEAVENGRSWCIANHNAHSVYLSQRDPEFAAFFDTADVIELDSTPIIFFTQLLGLHSRPFHRCTYLDWREHFWSLAQRNRWRVFYLGGEPGVAARAAERLTQGYPGALISTRHGYFDMSPEGAENEAVLAEIAAARPQILFVGMGMPRQEIWLLQNRHRLPPCVVFSVGAAFDYEAGVQVAAPRWIGRIGFEWLFRLAVDPRRLFHRYCVESWFLLAPAARDIAAAARAGRLFKRRNAMGLSPRKDGAPA